MWSLTIRRIAERLAFPVELVVLADGIGERFAEKLIVWVVLLLMVLLMRMIILMVVTIAMHGDDDDGTSDDDKEPIDSSYYDSTAYHPNRFMYIVIIKVL